MTFEGKDVSYEGTLTLYFNQTRMNAAIYSVDKKGDATAIGEADCVESTDWDRP